MCGTTAQIFSDITRISPEGGDAAAIFVFFYSVFLHLVDIDFNFFLLLMFFFKSSLTSQNILEHAGFHQ